MICFFTLLLTFPVMSQEGGNKPVYSASEGTIRVDAIDTMGAHVRVEYDYDLTKTYQQRSHEGVTTFAKYYDGRVIEYGTLFEPSFEFGKKPEPVWFAKQQ